ncbi:MAG: Glucose-6-phosphate isomerase, partial [uncultured Frankineae bacterium]
VPRARATCRTAARDDPAGAVRRRPGARAADVGPRRRALPRLLEEPPGRCRGRAAADGRARPRAGRADRGDVRRRAHQPHRGPRGPAHGAAPGGGPPAGGRRRGRDGAGAPGPAPHGGLHRERALGPAHRGDRSGLHARRQHRHRRLGPRAAHGRAGPAPQHRRHAAGPLRRQRRRRGPRGRPRRAGRRAHPVRRLLQDLHHRRDAGQRLRRAAVARAGARGRGRGAALRRRVDQRGEGARVRHLRGRHVRLLGLGGGALLADLRRRPVDHARDRGRVVPRAPGRLRRSRRALPHHPARAQPAGAAGPRRRVEPQRPRHGDARRPAVRPGPGAAARLPAAAGHGEQRQERHPRRRRGGHRHRPGRLGTARHQRAARVLPAAAPGDDPGALRHDRLHRGPERADRAARHPDGQLLRADAGAGLRPHRRGGRRGRRRCRAGAAPHLPGQPAEQHAAPEQPVAPHPRAARRDVRAQGLHAGRPVGGQLLRPVGGRAGQDPRHGAGAAAARRGRRRAARQLHRPPAAALPGVARL